MRTGKILLFASMAIVVLAFAGPASASASELYDVVTEEAPAENAEVELTGMSNFDTSGSGITCNVDVMWRYTPVANRFDMTGITFTISTCSGYGVNYKNCKVISASTTPTEMPSFSMTVEEEALNVKSTKVAFVSESSGGECKAKNSKFSFPSVIAKVNSPAGIETLALSGKGSVESELGTNEASTSGTLSVVGTNSGTYGIR